MTQSYPQGFNKNKLKINTHVSHYFFTHKLYRVRVTMDLLNHNIEEYDKNFNKMLDSDKTRERSSTMIPPEKKQ